MADNRILAKIARKGGGKLLNTAVGRLFPPDTAAPPPKKTVLGGLAAAVAVRVATRSVPGALVVGGGLLAKTLYDRRRGRAAKAAVDKQAEKGRDDTAEA